MFQMINKSQMGFVIPYAVFLFLGTWLSLIYSQEELSILVNSSHLPTLDFITQFATHLGDGFFVVFIGILMFFYNKRLAWTILVSYALSSGLVQLLKHTIFSDFHRPMHYLSQIPGIHLVQGVEMNYHNSFPSGHTTAAFALYTCLALAVEKIYIKTAFVFVAIFVAFTRVYLLQHFLIDTMFGSVLGLMFGYLFYNLIVIKGLIIPQKKYANS
jgi:membrane-associated phospholipid phosphatase